MFTQTQNTSILSRTLPNNTITDSSEFFIQVLTDRFGVLRRQVLIERNLTRSAEYAALEERLSFLHARLEQAARSAAEVL
jgi:hypothetical protein